MTGFLVQGHILAMGHDGCLITWQLFSLLVTLTWKEVHGLSSAT